MKRQNFTPLILCATLLVGLGSCGEKTEPEDETLVALKPLVTVEQVQKKDFKHQISIQGDVETEQDITLTAEMGGLITTINVKEGQKVTKGQVIAQVDASVLSSNLNELQTQLQFAEYMLKKQEELKSRGVGSEFELETAKNQVNSLKASMKSLNTQRGKSTIKAPFSGVIDQVFARKGQMTGPASPIARLVNNSQIDIVAGVSEKHFSKIKEGTPVEISFPNYSDTVVKLFITNVGNYIEPANRTFRVMTSIDNNTFFLPNMLAEMKITDLKVKEGIVVPSMCVLKDQDNNDYVYVAKVHSTDSKTGEKLYTATKVIVKVVERYEGEALLKSGAIDEKDMIVVEGAKGIANKDIVRTK